MIWQYTFTDTFQQDPDDTNHPRQVRADYSLVTPIVPKNPSLVAVSDELAAELQLDPRSPDFLDLVSGRKLPSALTPYAMNYAGHQFGNWAGQLGDGRAINLGEWNGQTLQLKGAGPTPYSRHADGLAVMRSSVREFLCIEAMHYLGIPTTRALSLVATGDAVLRDMFYDGNPAEEPGAIVCRVAPHFIRFGNFQLLTYRGQDERLRTLIDYVKANGQSDIEWFEDICTKTIDLVIDWMRVGFVHGVMNTDNMSILGLTIDYGPYGWLEEIQDDWTPNTTDEQMRRYAYGNQLSIAYWNLVKLAEAIHPALNDAIKLEEILDKTYQSIEPKWLAMMHRKLGLKTGGDEVIMSLMQLFHDVPTDMTRFYRGLCHDDFTDVFYKEPGDKLTNWLAGYKVFGQTDRELMLQSNPKFVLRNYLTYEAIQEVESGKMDKFNALMQALKTPYDESVPDALCQKRPDWALDQPGSSMLSCSS